MISKELSQSKHYCRRSPAMMRYAKTSRVRIWRRTVRQSLRAGDEIPREPARARTGYDAWMLS